MSQNSRGFWEFSVTVYGKDGVARACLDLQAAYALDVNLLLFCYWYALARGKLDDSVLHEALNFSESWKREVVQPLRNVRTWMKANRLQAIEPDSVQYHTLRERIKLDELAAEKIQQEALQEIAWANEEVEQLNLDKAQAATANVSKLLASYSIEWNEEIAVKLAMIAKAIEEFEAH